jgi:hypothetical protein
MYLEFTKGDIRKTWTDEFLHQMLRMRSRKYSGQKTCKEITANYANRKVSSRQRIQNVWLELLTEVVTKSSALKDKAM